MSGRGRNRPTTRGGSRGPAQRPASGSDIDDDDDDWGDLEGERDDLTDVPGPVPRDLGRRLATGIELDDGVAIADRFRVLEQAGSRALVEITLHEGRKHIVRRMLAEAGHPVSRLVRTTVGPIKLGGLRPGATRDLTTKEIGELYAAVGM